MSEYRDVAQNLPLVIGSRGSPLALAQTDEVCKNLILTSAKLGATGAIRRKIIKTSGDKFLSGSLSEVGGKGLFTKEIEDELLSNTIDIAVHSMKDVPTKLPDGLVIGCILPREDPRDAFISRTYNSINELPIGSRVGTASLRRKAQLLHLRPDLDVGVLRGNVETRLQKITDGIFDATLLAVSGLNRLGKANHITQLLSPEEILPAVAQGAIGLQCRKNDNFTRNLLSSFDDIKSRYCISAERTFLAELDGSCQTPIGALAEMIDADHIRFRGLIASNDGTEIYDIERHGLAVDGQSIGLAAGKELRNLGDINFFGK